MRYSSPRQLGLLKQSPVRPYLFVGAIFPGRALLPYCALVFANVNVKSDTAWAPVSIPLEDRSCMARSKMPGPQLFFETAGRVLTTVRLETRGAVVLEYRTLRRRDPSGLSCRRRLTNSVVASLMCGSIGSSRPAISKCTSNAATLSAQRNGNRTSSRALFTGSPFQWRFCADPEFVF